MARGNFLTGNVRGKIGDMVFYRQAGEQVIRPRTAHPHNPNTIPQRYQRAIMATILQNYAAGCEIFDHSFQGYRRGRECQARFLQLNLKMLRSYMANDINNEVPVAQQMGNVVAPRVPYPVPFEKMVVSEGSYAQTVFTEEVASGTSQWRIFLPEAITTETRAQYAARVGLVPDDIYTFVGINLDQENVAYQVPDYDDPYGMQFISNFFFCRLRVKKEPDSPTETMYDAPKIDVFLDVDSYSGISEPDLSRIFYSDDLIEQCTGMMAYGGYALIRSHWNEDLRSTSYMHLVPQYGDFGIRSSLALRAWTPEALRLGDSELVLEGGDS